MIHSSDYINLAEKYLHGEYVININGSTWKNAFEYLINNLSNYKVDKSVTHLMWTVNGGHLRNKIRDDKLILSVLKATLPPYVGTDLVLYRGECRSLFNSGKIGFCWTPEISVARQFASGTNAIESGGVLLQANVPAIAIISSPNYHSQKQMAEFEYTCNPELISSIKIIQTFPKYP